MKLALWALPVLVVAGVVTQAGAAAARGSTPLRTRPNSVLFWNAHDGLLAENRCPPNSACKSGAIELTTDGGRTYHVVLSTHGSFGLQTVGSQGAIASTGTGEIWRTLNRGRTWQRVHSRLTVYWLNPQTGVRFQGYIAHKRAKLAMLVTRDAGHTWQRRADPCNRTDATASASVDFATPTFWWIVCEGEGGAGNEDKAVFRTRNGGMTWTAGAVTNSFEPRHGRERGGISSYGYPVGLAVASDGWGLLTESRGTLYVTRDGGMDFHGEPHVARPELDFAGGAAAFDGGLGYVLLANYRAARLIETHDYGRTWQVVRRWSY